MRYLALMVVFAVCSVCTDVFAQDAAPAVPAVESPAVVEPVSMTLRGVIIDNLCAGDQSPEQMAEFVKTHSKGCALAPECAASGYSIFADGKLYRFDRESSYKVEAFLKQLKSTLAVVVEATQTNDQLSLVSIKNQ